MGIEVISIRNGVASSTLGCRGALEFDASAGGTKFWAVDSLSLGSVLLVVVALMLRAGKTLSLEGIGVLVTLKNIVLEDDVPVEWGDRA